MRRIFPLIAVVAAGALSLSACASSAKPEATATSTPSASAAEKLTIVATTNVWASVAKAVAGDNANVVAIINSPDQDPHDYQATAQDKLAFSKAAAVIVNGGGYDEWAEKLAAAAEAKPQLIDAVKISGLQKEDGDKKEEHKDHDHDHDHDKKDHDHDKEDGHHHHHHGEFNEHVFYSMSTAVKVAGQVKELLKAKDSANAAVYDKNTEKFTNDVKALQEKAAAFKKANSGVKAIATEPVVGYLLQDMGIEDITPEEFVEQSESDAGPSAGVVDATLKLISGAKTSQLVLNGQTEDAVSKKLADAAKTAGIPINLVYETFPQGVDTYTAFISGAIDSLSHVATAKK